MKGLALLACVLAALTFRQVSVWQNSQTLWWAAAAQEPYAPRPWINLAVERIAQGDFPVADMLLDHATVLSKGQDDFNRLWSQDLISVNRAVIRLGQGRLNDARSLLAAARPSPSRTALCQQTPVLCQ